MGIEALIKDPAKETHTWYKSSALDFPAAIEYSTGEILLAGAYRRLILSKVPEESAIDLGRLRELPAKVLLRSSEVPEDVWTQILFDRDGLRSPPAMGQIKQAKDLPQLSPLVPQIAWHAGVLGAPRGRWNPGNLLIGSLAAGTSFDNSRNILSALRASLLVDASDDLFARFLNRELECAAVKPPPTESEILDSSDIKAYRQVSPRRLNITSRLSPAEQAVVDLPSVLALKNRFTRRQWTSMVEGFMRFSLGSHILWVCRLNGKIWKLALNALEESISLPDRTQLEKTLYEDHLGNVPSLTLGQSALPIFRAHIEQYVTARFGLSMLAYIKPNMPELGSPSAPITDLPQDVHKLLHWLRTNRKDFEIDGHDPAVWARMNLSAILDKHPKYAGAQKSTFSNNIVEYLRHSMGKLQAIEDDDKEYDQYFLLRKTSKTNTAPWLIEPGPALQMLWVHLCCKSNYGSASLKELSSYLLNYGIVIPESQTAVTAPMRLESLGLVIDSPDAAGGRMLVDPFPQSPL